MEGLFSHTTKLIDDEGFVSRVKAKPQDFSRDRKLEFKHLLLAIMSFTKSSIQVELDRFYKSLLHSPDSFDTISKSAFTQSRKKLLPKAFIELRDEQLTYFQANAPHIKTWKGYRVVAIDGSLLNLPNSDEIKNHFGFTSNQHELMNRARCSFAYDVCNELILDAEVAAHKSCEKELAVNHLSKLDPHTDILVFDRGYPALWLMGLLQEKGFKFCFRLSSAWKDAATLTGSDENDIDWVSERRSKKDLGKLKTYSVASKIEGMRLVKVPLSSVETEILATNLLDRKDFDIQTLKSLYHLRWGIEESYKLFKKSIHIEYFTGKTTRSVEQEFYAKVFMLNMASMIRTQYIDPQKKYRKEAKHQQKVNKTQVLAKTKDFLVDLFYSYNIFKVLQQMKRMLNKCFDIVRPNRSFKRQETSSRRRHKSMNYKGI